MSSNTPRGISSAGTPFPSSFDGNSEFYEESRWQKFSRRLKEEPLIPLGCGLTCFALLGATRSIRAGDHNRTNRMFRARIYAQAFTLVAIVAGSMYWQTDREKRKEFEGAVAERKAKEKNEAWIRELEVRDEEEKELKALREARRLGGKAVREVKGAEGKIEKEVKKMVKEVKEGKVKGEVEANIKDGEKKAEQAAEEGVEKTKSVLDGIRDMVGGKK